MKWKLTIFLAFIISFDALGQYENVWAFGTYAGIDFNSNPPQAIRTYIRTNEGSASICDYNGQLLFYTDGTSVWDRKNNVMPNGRDLPNLGINITASTTQGALIVPQPGNAMKYYIFSLGDIQSGNYSGNLYYSIIDMNLNNGLGDVVASNKGILLDTLLTEHMTAVSGNSCNIWLLVASRIGGIFKTYNIDFNGIDYNPVVSPRIAGGGLYNGIFGSIDISPNRSKLAITQGNLVLYDFNPDLGKLSAPLILDPNFDADYYGASFSPDNTKLYTSTDSSIYQFDLSTNDSITMINSKTLLEASTFYPAIKRGPDNKVYCASHGNASLNVINKPNFPGIACQYMPNSFPLLRLTHSAFGLPNSAIIPDDRRRVNSSLSIDTVFCDNYSVISANNQLGINYIWDDGSSLSTRQVNSSGVYWVSYQASTSICKEYIDTFVVTFIPRKATTTLSTFNGMCKADTFLMKASNLLGLDYTWEDGSKEKQRSVNKTGIYWLSYQIDSLCEDYVDSFFITYPVKDYRVSFTSDTIICTNAPLPFSNTSDAHFEQFNWTFGDKQSSSVFSPEHVYLLPGIYQAILTGRINDRCYDTAYSTIIVDSPVSAPFLQDKDAICAGENITFYQQTPRTTLKNLQWDFGDETRLSTLDREISHAFTNAGSKIVLLKAEFRACPADSMQANVNVIALPEVDLGQDTSLCSNAPPLVLQNRKSLEPAGYRFSWSNGASTENIAVRHPGIYSLTISKDSLGCSSTEAITIRNDCDIDIPNAFTPNGDGINDYFFPRQELSRSPGVFSMQIFDRWGQLLFTTQKTDGRGWDGRWEGKPQPMGVYVYRITVQFKDRTPEMYQGNVTLMR